MKLIINADLYLDAIQEEDIPSLVKWCNDGEIYANTLSFPKDYTEAAGKQFLSIIGKTEKENGFQVNWAIRLEENAELIGSIGILNFTGDPMYKTEIGYWIAQPFRNRGWTTDIVKFFTGYIAEKHNLIRVFAHVMDHNPASVRVLEKAGFEKEGLLKSNILKDGKKIDTWLLARTF